MSQRYLVIWLKSVESIHIAITVSRLSSALLGGLCRGTIPWTLLIFCMGLGFCSLCGFSINFVISRVNIVANGFIHLNSGLYRPIGLFLTLDKLSKLFTARCHRFLLKSQLGSRIVWNDQIPLIIHRGNAGVGILPTVNISVIIRRHACIQIWLVVSLLLGMKKRQVV